MSQRELPIAIYSVSVTIEVRRIHCHLDGDFESKFSLANESLLWWSKYCTRSTWQPIFDWFHFVSRSSFYYALVWRWVRCALYMLSHTHFFPSFSYFLCIFRFCFCFGKIYFLSFAYTVTAVTATWAELLLSIKWDFYFIWITAIFVVAVVSSADCVGVSCVV